MIAPRASHRAPKYVYTVGFSGTGSGQGWGKHRVLSNTFMTFKGKPRLENIC